MIHIIEGTDAVGKSTYATWLAAAEGGKSIVVHKDKPEYDNAVDEYVQPLLDLIGEGYTTIICDRWHIGELVWPRVFGRPSLFQVEDAWQEVHECLSSLGVDITVMWRPGEEIVRELWQRGEADQAVDVLRAQHLFINLAMEQGLTLIQSKDLPPFNMQPQVESDYVRGYKAGYVDADGGSEPTVNMEDS